MSQKEQEEDSLFNINLSSSEEEFIKEADKVPRGHQSEAHFQRQKAEWKPKIENGEIWKSLKLPIHNPSKPESQWILHAVEELYFIRRYREALRLVEEVLKGELSNEFRKLLEDYRVRCDRKVDLR